MRLWHVDLIPFLPRQQLLGQWRECVLIAKNLAEKGTPNHVLVNKILEYSSDDFLIYGEIVMREMRNRGYTISEKSEHKFYEYNKLWRNRRKNDLNGEKPLYCRSLKIFYFWHTNQYLDQCYYNLQEKHDCNILTTTEYNKIQQAYVQLRGSI